MWAWRKSWPQIVFCDGKGARLERRRHNLLSVYCPAGEADREGRDRPSRGKKRVVWAQVGLAWSWAVEGRLVVKFEKYFEGELTGLPMK